MRLRSPAILAHGCIATLLLLGTRLPTPRAGWAVVVLALSAVLAGLVLVAAWGRERRGLSIAVTFAGICLAATPPSASAPLRFVPDALVALALLALLHASWASEMPHAPPLKSAAHAPRGATLMRWLSLLPGFLALALVPPLLLMILPDRIASSLELRGSAGPLAFGLLIVFVVLAITWIRDAFAAAPTLAPQSRAPPSKNRTPTEVEP